MNRPSYNYWIIFGCAKDGWFILNRYHYPLSELGAALIEGLEHQKNRFFRKHIPELIVTVVEAQGDSENRGGFLND